MHLHFKSNTEAGKILLSWWEKLEDNKGGWAALRRCGTTLDVVFIPAYQQLCKQLMPCEGLHVERLPAVAGLLAHVRTNTGGDLAKQIAAPKTAGGNPVLSELRFRRLLQYQTQDELFPALRRVIHLLGKSADIYSLAESVYWWNDHTRKAWAYTYYGTLKD